MAAKGYTTEVLVEAEIGKAISATTTPTTDQVAQWIEEAESYIDRRTHTSFTAITETNEIYPWNENTAFISPTSSVFYGYHGNMGRRDYGLLKYGNAFRLNRSPVTAITTLELNQAAASATDSWTAKTENTGSGGDFVVDLETGIVTLLTEIPRYGERSIRVTYNYGHTSIPAIVKTLATKMVARRVIDMTAKKNAFTSTDTVSLASLSIKKELRQNVEHLRQLDVEIEDLFRQVGELYTQWV